MNYNQAVEYLEGVSWLGSRPGLERIGALLERLGRPQDKLRFVHVAGTNGKGSVCALLRSVLSAAGYRTGLYISPHLARMNERMSIDGVDISDADFAGSTAELAGAASGMAEPCTQFELTTALALHWFAKERCDIVVLETGLGGRLDATNAIGEPECAVITNIGLDHTAVLGDTLEQIAAEKAGIFKGGRAAAYDLPENVRAVLREKAEATGTDLRFADLTQLEPLSDGLSGQSFRYRGAEYSIRLLGAHQLANAATALEAVEQLRRGREISDDAVRRGLAGAVWPARFERVLASPDFVIDGGHNPQCLTATAAALRRYYPDTPRVLLFGALADKDWRDMARLLIPVADEFVCATPESPRALDARELAEFLLGEGCRAAAFDTIEAAAGYALKRAGELGGMACCVGSLYMAGAARAYLLGRGKRN